MGISSPSMKTKLTILTAAREVGRKAIGIDANEAECEKAAKRLQQAHLPL